MALVFNIIQIIIGANFLFNKFINELLNCKIAPGVDVSYNKTTLKI